MRWYCVAGSHAKSLPDGAFICKTVSTQTMCCRSFVSSSMPTAAHPMVVYLPREATRGPCCEASTELHHSGASGMYLPSFTKYRVNYKFSHAYQTLHTCSIATRYPMCLPRVHTMAKKFYIPLFIAEFESSHDKCPFVKA